MTQPPSPEPSHPSVPPTVSSTTSPVEIIPEELAVEIRRLAHDLSNALEIIVQTSYLLSLAELKEPASQWLDMLNSGMTRALDTNQALRVYIKDHSPR